MVRRLFLELLHVWADINLLRRRTKEARTQDGCLGGLAEEGRWPGSPAQGEEDGATVPCIASRYQRRRTQHFQSKLRISISNHSPACQHITTRRRTRACQVLAHSKVCAQQFVDPVTTNTAREPSPNVQDEAMLDLYFARFHAKPYHILDESTLRQRLQLSQVPAYLIHSIFAVAAR